MQKPHFKLNTSICFSAVFFLLAVSARAYSLIEFSQYVTPPADLTNVIAIAASYDYALALRSDGTIAAWGGSNQYGQTNVPSDLTNVVAISAGEGAAMALKGDGTVVGWGDYLAGQPNDLSNIVAVSAGDVYGLALKSDGTVATLGPVAPLFSSLSNVVAIASGGNIYNLALKSDGTVVLETAIQSWRNTNVPPGLSNIVSVAMGQDYLLALKGDGAVVSWPSYGGYVCSPPTATLSGLSNVVAITGHGWGDGVVLRADGTMVGWSCFDDDNPSADISNVVAIAYSTHALALIGDGPPMASCPLSAPHWETSGFGISVQTQRQRVYRMEYKNSLADPDWIAFPLVAGNGQKQTLIDTNAVIRQRFYRVRQW